MDQTHIMLQKVRAHTRISSNKILDQLANKGTTCNKPTSASPHTHRIHHTLMAQQNSGMQKPQWNPRPPDRQIPLRTRTTQNPNLHTSTNGYATHKLIKNPQTIFGNPHNILCTNSTYLEIPIRPIHGKPLIEHLLATNISQPQMHILPKPHNRHAATPTLHL